MNYLTYFFNPAHLFNLRPQAMTNRAVAILGIICVILIIAGIVVRVMLPKIKDGLKIKGIRRLMHLFFTVGGLGLTYLFFGWQGMALLGARFWLLIIILVGLVWLAFILKYLFLVVPKRRAEIDGQRNFKKYLP
jgi:hypothetical protein